MRVSDRQPVSGTTFAARRSPRQVIRTAAWVVAFLLVAVALRLLLSGGGPIAVGLAGLAALVVAVCPIVPPWAVARWRRGSPGRAEREGVESR
jgi:hypothetical protein